MSHPITNRIIVDFDGTICGFKFPDVGPPEPGVRKALQQLKDDGFEIVVHSCRTGTYWNGKNDSNNRLHHIAVITNFLVEHKIPYDALLFDKSMDKPIADFYIDDKGVSYRGNWDTVISEIRNRVGE